MLWSHALLLECDHLYGHSWSSGRREYLFLHRSETYSAEQVSLEKHLCQVAVGLRSHFGIILRMRFCFNLFISVCCVRIGYGLSCYSVGLFEVFWLILIFGKSVNLYDNIQYISASFKDV
jgi:hypothetical protein